LPASVSESTKADRDEAAKAQWRRPVARLPIYNYSATSEDRITLGRAGGEPEPADIQSLFRGGNVDYYRTISSDEKLAEVLAQELRRRGIDLCPKEFSRDVVPPLGSPCLRPHHDRVFLLSEWDTAYGRYLPQSVSETFGADESSFGGCRLNTSHGILHASYLRGLDGRLPSRRVAKEIPPSGRQNGRQILGERGEQTEGAEASATPETASRFESAEGQSQFDYLRRLTQALKECDEKLRYEGAGRIAAIGVLGSDVYDKLLLLQALRPEFPDTIFFTTDLDELLLPQEKLRYTRNLLVASGHDLTLIPEVQKDVLPFRSSYQTSIFLATTLAIRNSNLPAPKTDAKGDPWPDTTAALNCWLKRPLLFQIGRTAPRGLPIQPLDGEEKACQNQTRDLSAGFIKSNSIDPKIMALYPEFMGSARFGIFLAPIALLGFLLSLAPIRKLFFSGISPTGSSGQEEAPSPLEPSVRWLVPLVVAALLIWALVTLGWSVTARWLTDYPDGDPMALFEGISIWPTIALRTLGTILSLFLIWWTLRTLEINRYKTAHEMGIPVVNSTSPEEFNEVWNNPAMPGRWARIVSLIWFPPQSSYPNPLGCDDADRPKVRFLQIVTRYSLRWWVRCMRAGIATVFMMLVIWPLILVPVFGRLTVPVRGVRAGEIYSWVTLFNVITTLFLTFLIVDATLYSRKFISRLTRISTVWPDQTFAKFARRYGLPRGALADWIDLQYLAKRTRCVTRLIYLPFISLTVMIMGRSRLFDDFPTSWTALAAQAISITLIVGSVLSYRLAAENARKTARNNLTAKIVAAQGASGTASQLQLLLNEIESLKEGAFAPLTSQPIVKAVLLPLVTYGGAWLAHIYGLPGT
jgi:hypothetical protein